LKYFIAPVNKNNYNMDLGQSLPPVDGFGVVYTLNRNNDNYLLMRRRLLRLLLLLLLLLLR